MNNFVISLKSATERREHINNEFGKHNVSFEFFDALTPDTARDYAKNLGLNPDTTNLTSGELACMMSHIAVWKKAINKNLSYVTIFEDDVYLGKDANHLLNSTEWINPSWNVIKIEAFSKKALLSTTQYDVLSTKRQVVQLKGKNLGAAGYILSTKGAELLFNYTLSCDLQPIDEIIFDLFIKKKTEPVYQMVPALCIQEMIFKERQDKLSLPSSLEQERKHRMKLEKKQGFAKIQRELSRLTLQIKRAFIAKTILFK